MPSTSSNTPVSQFFKPYASYGFHYDPAQSATREFSRLYKHMKWTRPKGEEPPRPARIARHMFGQALIEQFSNSFGKDVDSLESWQALCAAVYIDPVPDTLQEAQIAFERTHVNLVDLTERHVSKKPIQIFPTVKALSDYTKANKRYFPREDAKELGSLLRRLLRNIRNPEIDDESLRRGGSIWRGGDRRAAGRRKGHRQSGSV